jgi:DNA-binding transcriptional regulator LsrR (DeoR family)
MHGLTGETGLHAGEDGGLATRAAWLYHAGGFTQSEVAGKLGVTSAKAHRLIGRATRAGLVRVFVDGPIGDCIATA